MHEYSGGIACFEHSNFFKVNLLASRDTRLRAPLNLQQKHGLQSSLSSMITAPRPLRSNYELFNHNNFNIRYWSWNYHGCWHHTCPPIDKRTFLQAQRSFCIGRPPPPQICCKMCSTSVDRLCSNGSLIHTHKVPLQSCKKNI